MLLRPRRPLARAAMIGGTAYAANRMGRRSAENQQREYEQEARLQGLEQQQQGGYAAPPPAAPQAAPAPSQTDIASKLTELKGLMDQGVLTPDEFNTAKAKLLAGS